MFDKLKKAFSSAAKSIGQKEISEKDLDNTLFDLQLALLESDVAQEVTDSLSAKLKKDLLGLKLEKGETTEEIIRSKLQNAVAEIFAKAGKVDLVQLIKTKKESKSGPFVIAFLGINGTGKTTTVAKVAHMLRKSGISVVLAAADTHRAGAIEQLSQHAERLSLKVIAQRYGADPSAVGRDALDYAKKHYIDAVLIDTAGRMQTSKNLMDEMSKIVRVVKPDMKLFIGDALAGNDTINQAREFFQYTNFDGAILTKIDADAKGGAAISISHITSKPVLYIGVGQGYDDIIPFDSDKFLESLFGSAPTVSVENLMPATPVTVSEAPKPEVEVTSSAPLVQAVVNEPKPEPEIAPPPKYEAKPPEEIKPEPAKQQVVVGEQPKEKKKSRFGFFGKKTKEESVEEKKEEQEKPEKKESKKHKEEEEAKDDKVIYLTDEDIEDLLK